MIVNKIKLAACDLCNETAESSDKAHHYNPLINFIKKNIYNDKNRSNNETLIQGKKIGRNSY